MPWRLQSEPTMTDKVVAGLNYPTFGVVGLIYTLLGKGGSQGQFFRFHFIQSILLWIIGMLLSWAAGILVGLLLNILRSVSPGAAAPTALVVGYADMILTNAFWLLLAYGAVMAFLGKFAEVPVISNLVRQNMR